MAEVEVEDRDNHHHRYISPMSNFPRDLLRTFMGVSDDHSHLNMPVVKLERQEEEELELSLGLSLNGRFGVDPTAKKIKRTTSIPEFVRDEEMGRTGRLVRTTSLPTETEEEWRKSKELQTLRRMEARRKRSQKQRNLKALREQQHQRVPTQGTNPGEQGAGGFGEPALPLSLTTHVCELGLTRDTQKENGGALLPPSSRVSKAQGTTPMDVRSPASTNSLPDSELKSPAGVAGAVTMRSQSNKHSPPQNKTEDFVRNLLEDMPCVSTKGESPNGKRKGFLYRYGKGEEVRIVCVCHGSFLTPSEFVKHAGGGEVANPLKHIVVSPSFL